MKVNWKLLLAILSIVGTIILTNFVQFVQAPRPYRGFIISLPEEMVEVGAKANKVTI
jgi:hypothetical protein